MPVLALIISTIFEKLEWQNDLIIGLPILIIGAILVINQKIKLGRIGEVEDIMGAAVYLASDASSMVTGTHMIIDGGWTAG